MHCLIVLYIASGKIEGQQSSISVSTISEYAPRHTNILYGGEHYSHYIDHAVLAMGIGKNYLTNTVNSFSVIHAFIDALHLGNHPLRLTHRQATLGEFFDAVKLKTFLHNLLFECEHTPLTLKTTCSLLLLCKEMIHEEAMQKEFGKGAWREICWHIDTVCSYVASSQADSKLLRSQEIVLENPPYPLALLFKHTGNIPLLQQIIYALMTGHPEKLILTENDFKGLAAQIVKFLTEHYEESFSALLVDEGDELLPTS